MNNRDWKAWAKAAGVRALRTMAQAALSYIGGATMFGEVNWQGVASAAVMGGVISVLMAFAGLPEVEE